MPHHEQMKHLCSGKVRDIYEYDKNHLLFKTSNRISAFDVVLPNKIPGKGRILNELSIFWMNMFSDFIPNHIADVEMLDLIPFDEADQLMVVKKMTPLKIEAIVRGYLIGSGWKDYQQTRSVCGIELPQGLRQAEKLPAVIYTPSTKANVGDHDANITLEESAQILESQFKSYLGANINYGYMALDVMLTSIKMYKKASEYALDRGIIIADTKFEFGIDEAGKLHLIDEVLTPDSSRFWSDQEYSVGISPPSYDKQIIRDYLETLDWNKKPPAPNLPNHIIEKTASKYAEIKKKLTGPPLHFDLLNSK